MSVLVASLLAVSVLLHRIWRDPPEAVLGTVLITLGICIPILLSVSALNTDIPLFGQRDLSFVSFAIGAALVSLGLVRRRALSVVPVAHLVVFDNLPDPALVLDVSGKIIDLNRAAIRALGVARGQPAPVRSAGPHRREDRSYDVQSSPLLVGSTRGTVLLFRDVTDLERARAEAEGARADLEVRVAERTEELTRTLRQLIAAESRIRTMVENSFQLIGLLDADGTLLEANRRAIEVSGLPESALIGRPFWEGPWWSHDPQLVQRLRDAVERAAAGAFVRFEARHPGLDGPPLIVDFSLTPVVDADGVIRRLIPEGRDITALRAAEAQARELAGRLAQAERLESLGRLAAGVAHDFNNLLFVIEAALEMAAAALPADHAARPDIVQAYNTAKRAEGIIAQLLQFARQGAVAGGSTDLAVVAGQHAPSWRRLLGDAVHLEVEVEPGCPPVALSPAALDQVVLNLIANARDAVAPGGHVRVSVRRRSGLVAVTVEDDGCGMTDEVKLKVFEPFFSTKAPGRGTGLGMATVWGVVRQAGGEVVVHSEVGRGTRVEVRLPSAAGVALDEL